MEAQLPQTLARTSSASNLAWQEVLFSVSEARRALPYVARVAGDAVDAFRHVQLCRVALSQPLATGERTQLSERRDQALHRLNAAIDECNAVGADLLDLGRGAVSFAAQVRGCRASLIWHVGEPVMNAWETLLDSAE